MPNFGGMGGMPNMGGMGGRSGGMAFDPNDLIRMMFSANSMGGGTGGPGGFE